jgi:hypothetical protein
MRQFNNVAFGSDAEVFLYDMTNRPFPVCGMVGGTKQQPKPLGLEGYFVQEDNCALEFNIPVCSTREEWTRAFAKASQLLNSAVPGHFRLAADPVAEFDKAFLQIPQTRVFGCEPDFNAWTMDMNATPEVPEGKEGMRTAAAHVHISWDKPDEEQRIALVRASDIFVSLNDVLETGDTSRRLMYGKAGAFRFKEYGIEHRVLSNDWLWTKEGYIWDRYQNALMYLNMGGTIDEADHVPIQNAINKYDKDLSVALFEKYYGKLMRLAQPPTPKAKAPKQKPSVPYPKIKF